MLTAEERMEVVVLRKHGASIRELARSTGRSRNTVRRYLREGEAAATRKPAPQRAEKLDPFRDYIVERMKAAADRIPAAVLFREIKARGYDGGETRLKQFVRGLLPAAPPEPAVRFETEPGHQIRRTGRRSEEAPTSSRCSSPRSGGAGRPTSSSATTRRSRR
jgi:transposase